MKPNPYDGAPFNLIEQRWLPVRRRSGRLDHIAPCELALIGNDPPVAFAWMRPDLNTAAYEWAIGVLSTAYAPDNEEAWERDWNRPPETGLLDECFAPIAAAFNVDGDGPRFAQDLDLLEEGKIGNIAKLLIDTPGQETRKNNAALFAPQASPDALGPAATAIALYTLQCFAPMGGGGNLTSLRGGGPLGTIIIAAHPRHGETLWGRLWPNVETGAQIRARARAQGHGNVDPFPWMHATRISVANGGNPTTPDQTHALVVYWSTPRRIRVVFTEEAGGHCAITGEIATTIARTMRHKGHGALYPKESYRHPLTPYTNYKKVGTNPVLARTGYNSYRVWPIGIAARVGAPNLPAQAIRAWREGREPAGTMSRCASYGYEMSGMLVMGWVGGELPLMNESEEVRPWVETFGERTASAASRIARWLTTSSRHAEPVARKMKLGETNAIAERFFDATTTAFYREMAQCKNAVEAGEDPAQTLAGCAIAWRIEAAREAMKLFDEDSPVDKAGHAGAVRAAQARSSLRRRLGGWGVEGRKLFEDDLGIPAPATRRERNAGKGEQAQNGNGAEPPNTARTHTQNEGESVERGHTKSRW